MVRRQQDADRAGRPDPEGENSTLKRLLAGAELEKAALREIAKDAPIDRQVVMAA